MRPSLPRVSLLVSGLLFAGLGGYFLFDPSQVSRLLGLPTPAAALRAELSAVYGGLQLGLGIFFLVSAARARWVRAALAAQIAVFAGLAAGRVLGLITQGVRSGLLLLLLVLELAGLLLGLAAFHRAKRLMLEYAARGLL